MASIYKRDGSIFWWIKYRALGAIGKARIIRESTGLRWAHPAESRKARVLEATRTAEELAGKTGSAALAWDAWVTEFLRARYGHSPLTLQRYLIIWHTFREYLKVKEVPQPVNLTRAHCLGYPVWRSKTDHAGSTTGKKVHHNTALLELKVFSMICNEAVARGFIEGNPCSRLGLKRMAPQVKREMTDEHVRIIRAEIARLKEGASTAEEKANATFYEISFEIASKQGIRLKETNLDLSGVDFEMMEIQVHAKGDKFYTAPLNPSLVPLLRGLIAAGRRTAYDAPAMPSLKWFKFFDGLRARHADMKRVSFHSTRVTVVSRLERSGAPENKTMRLVNHASTTVHRTYRRMKPEELSPYWSALDDACGDTPVPGGSQGFEPSTPAPTPALCGGRG